MQFIFVSFDSVLYLVKHFNESIIYILKMNVNKHVLFHLLYSFVG